MASEIPADQDPETRQLARLAYLFCRSAARPIASGVLPHLRLEDVMVMMWEENQKDLVRLWGRVHEILPDQDRRCLLNDAVVTTLPRESLSIAEIFVGTLRSNVTDHFLHKAVADIVPPKTSGRFLVHAAPHLANVFHK